MVINLRVDIKGLKMEMGCPVDLCLALEFYSGSAKVSGIDFQLSVFVDQSLQQNKCSPLCILTTS